jgi:TatD DNase family protein
VGLFDVHAHLTSPRLVPREAEVLDNAERVGITSILVNGLNPSDNEAVRALAARTPVVKACYGFYPVDTVLTEMDALAQEGKIKKYPRDVPACTMEEGIAWVRQNAAEAFAIGEIGLDGYWVPKELWEKQEQAFRALVQIALDHDKAIIIHTRRREKRTLEILDEMGVERVDWHCFGGKIGLARQIAERGHCLSIPSNARRHEGFTRMLETLPRDQILLETDCPYLGPMPGEDSEPACVAETAKYAAELWKCSIEEANAQFERSFEKLFRVRP